VAAARVIELPGANYYMFLSNDADALRELRGFLGAFALVACELSVRNHTIGRGADSTRFNLTVVQY